MSQYNTRINIKVNDGEKWELLSDINFEDYGLSLTIEDLEDFDEFILDGDWSLTEDELYCFVEEFVDKLENNVTIAADTTNINVDPYLYYVCAIDGEIISGYTSCDDDDFIEQYDLNILTMNKYFKILGIIE